MGRVTYLTVSTAALVALLACASPVRAADEDPVKSLTLSLEGACDAKNSRLFVESKHQTKTIIATLRWNLAGSKRIASDQFQIGPGSRVEIGCAAQADIVSAVFVQ
jgi:hypothetical protein